VPHPNTDSLRSLSTELEPVPKDSWAFTTKRLESSPEVPETPAVALEKMQHEEDGHSNDGNTSYHSRGS
jgi:hypothetical protein